jgi:hypothetical protein
MMKWEGHVENMGEKGVVPVGKPQAKRSYGIILKWILMK